MTPLAPITTGAGGAGLHPCPPGCSRSDGQRQT